MGKIERVEDIAIDGKTIRSSSVGLMAALVHKDGTVVAQKRLDGPKGHEIPAALRFWSLSTFPRSSDSSGVQCQNRHPPRPGRVCRRGHQPH